MKSKISVKDIRKKNKTDILLAIINNDGITRSQLAKLSNVSLMTISNVIDDLLENKCIYEVKCKASIGRTPTMLYFNDNLGRFLCIDLTSNKNIKYLITDAKKQTILSDTIPLDSNITYEKNLQIISEKISSILSENDINVLGIGIIAPGPHIDNTDTIATNLIKEQQDIEVKDFIKTYFGTDIIMINHDVNLAAIAEFQGLPSNSSLFYIYISEGVGGSFINEGKLIQGVDLQSGDIGQVLITLEDGRVECLENLISLPSIEANSPVKLTLEELIEEYNRNNPSVKGYMDKLLGLMARQIYNISWLLNPEYIVLYSTNKDISECAIRYFNEQTALKGLSSSKLISTKVRPSQYDTNPAIVGTLERVILEYVKTVCCKS